MASIGTLGTLRDAVDLDFEYFGLVIRVNPDTTDLNMWEFLESAAEIDESNAAQSIRAIGTYLRDLIHPDDWDTFWRASKANRQQLPDLMQTARAITEAVAGFPTGQRSGSSDGQPSTSRKSGGGTSSQRRASSRTRQIEADSRAALSMVVDRPDLKVVVADAHQARASRAG